MELVLSLLVLGIVFSIGFLVGAKQEQNRLKPKEYIVPDEVKEQLQKLAGIIEHDRNNGSKVLADIMDGLAKKKDAATEMFTSAAVTEFLKKDSVKNVKQVLDKSIDETKRFNEYRKKNTKMPAEVKIVMMEAPLVKTRKKSKTK